MSKPHYRCLPIIAMLYVSCLLISTIMAFKVVKLGPAIFPAGLVIFPLSFIFDDILTEVYGYQYSRRIIWTGLVCNVLFFAVGTVAVILPPAPFWPFQHEFSTVVGSVPRIVLASSLSYFCSEFLNSYVLAKLKIRLSGKHYWLRLMSSTSLGSGVDSLLFCSIAFMFTMPLQDLGLMILWQFMIKVTYEFLVIPLTYVITNYLKKVEQVDHYDVHTRFTPFSLKTE